MIRSLVLAPFFAGPAAAQQPIWAGASRLRCDIEVARTCSHASCEPMQIMRVVLVDLATQRICASHDGVACGARLYDIVLGDQIQAGRLVVVVRNTGTTYSVGADGRMSGASVVAPLTHVFLGRCAPGPS